MVADVQGYFRKVRKEQVRSFVVHARADVADWIKDTCTQYHAITITAPVAGRILVRAQAIVSIIHTNGVTEDLRLFIGTTPTDCTSPLGDAAWYRDLSSNPSSTVTTTLPVLAVLDVAPGSYT